MTNPSSILELVGTWPSSRTVNWHIVRARWDYVMALGLIVGLVAWNTLLTLSVCVCGTTRPIIHLWEWKCIRYSQHTPPDDDDGRSQRPRRCIVAVRWDSFIVEVFGEEDGLGPGWGGTPTRDVIAFGSEDRVERGCRKSFRKDDTHKCFSLNCDCKQLNWRLSYINSNWYRQLRAIAVDVFIQNLYLHHILNLDGSHVLILN